MNVRGEVGRVKFDGRVLKIGTGYVAEINGQARWRGQTRELALYHALDELLPETQDSIVWKIARATIRSAESS